MSTRQLGAKATRPTDLLSLQDSIITGAIAGLTTANDNTTPATVLDVAVGLCADSTGQYLMRLGSAWTKSIASNFAIGTGAGGLDTGTVANSTWYHVHLIYNPTTAVSDILFSLSPTAPTLPSGYTAFRRIASIYYVSSAIKPFSQNGNEFLWKVPLNDIASNTSSSTTTPITLTALVPIGIKVNALVGAYVGSANAATQILITALDVTSPNFGPSNSGIVSSANGTASFTTNVRTNLSGQFNFETNQAATPIYMGTQGWIDTFGITTSTVSYRSVINNLVQFPGGVSGLTLSNDATTPATVLDIAPGMAADTTNAVMISIAPAMTKTLAAFVAGSGNGGLDYTGSATASTWHFVHAIYNPTTLASDVLISKSAVSPTLPSGFTLFRRIGSVWVNSTPAIFQFKQIGNKTYWVDTPPTDLNGLVLAQGTPQQISLNGVPSGVVTTALLGGYATSANVPGISFTPLGVTAVTTNSNVQIPVSNGYAGLAELPVETDGGSPAKIRGQCFGGSGVQATITGAAVGWIDTLGAPSAGAVVVTQAGNNGYPINGRMALTSGRPIDITAVTSGTIYFTPWRGRTVSLWNGSDFVPYNFAELSYSLASTAVSTVYDLFVWNGPGGPTLVAAVWSSTTARVSPLTVQYGLLVNSAAVGACPVGYGTYVGTFATDATGHTCTFNPTPAGAAKGATATVGYWNEYNRQKITTRTNDTTATWQPTTTSYGVKDSSTINMIVFVVGRSEDALTARNMVRYQSSTTGTYGAIAIGLDSNSMLSSACTAALTYWNSVAGGTSVISTLDTLAPAGLHTLYPLEQVSASAASNIFIGASYDSFAADLMF